MEQTIRYARSADGTQIAYADVGEGMPLLVASNIWAHLDLTWGQEAGDGYRRIIREGIRLVRFDMRGMGMSDHDVQDFAIERQMEDIDAVRERTGLERFALWSIVHATPAGIAYAAAHPERVTHLILSVPFTNGAEWYRSIPTLRGLESFRDLGEGQWELYTLTHATALSASTMNPDPTALAALMRASTTAATLRLYFEVLQTQDVTASLPGVKAPTLVIEPERTDLRTFSRAVVAGIPDAAMVFVDTALALGLRDVAPVVRFLLGRDPSSASDGQGDASSHATAVILFADVVESTAIAARIGNAAFRERTRQLEDALRAVIAGAGGAPVEGRTLGDGVLGVFTSAAQAIDAALQCGGHADRVGLQLHLGIHAGDVIRESGGVSGVAVNIASRISDLTGPNEILVSSTVRDLARASTTVTFEDRGEHALKGIADHVRVWAVVGAPPLHEDGEGAGG